MSGEEEQLDIGGFQMMGIVNALKTGDVTMDMMIAMCIPLLLRFLFNFVEQAANNTLRGAWWVQWFKIPTVYHERIIALRPNRSYYSGGNSLEEDTRNAVLIKAIQMYLNHVRKLDLQRANLDLICLTESNDCNRYYYCHDDDGNEKTLAGRLKKYRVIKKPFYGEWTHVGYYGKCEPCKETNATYSSILSEKCCSVEEENEERGVELHISENQEGNGEENNTKTTLVFRLRSFGKNSIDAFIDTAYDWYMDELKQLDDDSRYFYEMESLDDDTEDASGGNSFKRYRLSDEKTFESLFFKEKDQLLGLVKHFCDKSGKYAIKGYPHKLGVLLHGPPGTGKTSLIKALAQHTGRSIVSVPLGKISTNKELMSLFYDQKYNIAGEHVPIKLGFKDVIYVMEDVDAASRVVRRRAGKKTAEDSPTEQIDLPAAKSIWRMLLESVTDGDCNELVELLKGKSERLKKASQDPEIVASLANRMSVLPGLGFVGEHIECDELNKIGDDALEEANNLMGKYSTVDRFMGTHARSIKALIEAGTEIDDGFVDQLLNASCNKKSNMVNILKAKSGMSRNGSRQDEEDEEEKDVNFADFASSMVESKPSSSKKSRSSGGSSDDKTTDGFMSSYFRPPRDQLNLTGLLNVLDGVVDTPGRILIMTTNHPEMLDPALIRPGRIDKKLMLGFMRGEDVCCMLEHYFQVSLSESQKERVMDAVNGKEEEMRAQLELTPAQVEQLTAEYDDLDDMIDELYAKGRDLGGCAHRKKSGSRVRYNI